MTVAVIVDAVELEAFARDIVHQLVAAGEDVVLVPTDGLKQLAPGWDADGFAEMVRNPAAPAHLDGTEWSLASALARSTAADMPSVEWLDPGTGAYGRAPAVTSSGEMFDAAWVEAWYRG